MSDIIAKLEEPLALVGQAIRALESGDASTSHRLIVNVKRCGVSTIKETKYLLERVKSVEEFFRKQDINYLRKIHELYDKEQLANSRKDTVSFNLRLKKSDLQKSEEALTSARDERAKARARREDANESKYVNIVGAIGFGAATVLTLGLALPVTVPGMAVCVSKAVDHAETEDRATETIDRCTDEINRSSRAIVRYERDISEVNTEMDQLSRNITALNSERSALHSKRSEISEAIKFIYDVHYFWEEFVHLVERGTERATLLEKISGLMKEFTSTKQFLSQGHSRALKSCISAWEQVENKLHEEGIQNLFSIDFSCYYCSKTFLDLPHLEVGRFVCAACHFNC